MKTFREILPVLLFLALWEALARSGFLAARDLFPPFTTVMMEVVALFRKGMMTQSLFSSLFRVMAGLCFGAVSGIAVGAVMGWKRSVHRSLSPVVSVLYPVPTLGWLPLLMIWVGIDEMLPIAVIAIGCFFPVCYNTSAGIRNVDGEMIKAARILGASDRRILLAVVLPIAMPHIFAGLRLSSGMAWRMVIAAEMVAIPTGIGALLMKAESLIRVDIIMACLVVLSVMCLLFEKGFSWMERHFAGAWYKDAPY